MCVTYVYTNSLNLILCCFDLALILVLFKQQILCKPYFAVIFSYLFTVNVLEQVKIKLAKLTSSNSGLFVSSLANKLYQNNVKFSHQSDLDYYYSVRHNPHT